MQHINQDNVEMEIFSKLISFLYNFLYHSFNVTVFTFVTFFMLFTLVDIGLFWTFYIPYLIIHGGLVFLIDNA